MEFGTELLIVAALIFFVAAFIHGSIGFGFPLVSTPLLAIVTDMQTAIILTLVPTLLVNLISIASEGNIPEAIRRHLPLALLAMAGASIGTFILIFASSQIFEALLALAIIGYLLSEKLNLDLSWVHQHPRSSRFVFGISAGVLGGLTNVMAPVLIIYSLASKHTKSEIIQASNFCFMFGKFIQIILFSIYGKFNLGVLSTSSVMLIAVSIALFFGIKLRRKIDVQLYKTVLRGFLLILAFILFIKVAHNMA